MSRRLASFDGLFFDEFANDSAWIRADAAIRLPPLGEATALHLVGEIRVHPEVRGLESGFPGLDVSLSGRSIARLRPAAPGPFRVKFSAPAAATGSSGTLHCRLAGVGVTNALAWLGRVAAGLPFSGRLQRFRRQNRNRQVRILRIETEAGEVVFDFADRDAPFSAAFARRRVRLGFNLAGFLTADLGVGESARCMVRAADAAGIATALVDLKLPSKNRRGDLTYGARLQEASPYPVSIVHLDPPASRDIDHHHPELRRGKYNIGYWAWELPEFPDSWMPYCDYFDEIWCPSDFSREAIALKSPVPVIAMPHSMAFERPKEDTRALRARFRLPERGTLFLCLFDLNSYAERKNPAGAVEAYRRSGLAGRGSSLVIKVQNAAGNPADLAALQAAVRDLPGTVMLTDTLSRADTYALEAACDALVSLHRAEGFGLVVAEAMLLGKPVIATDWSATAEYLDASNGCPVSARLVTLAESHGPYSRGQTWADPDVDQAADWMRRLAADPGLGSRLGAAARQTIETRFSPSAIGARYRLRLEAIAGW